MMDKIIIEDLAVMAILGVYAEERVTPQKVLVNVELWTDITRPAASDDLADAVNYADLVQRIEAHVQAARACLIERLVSELADLILREYTAVSQVKIRVDKPDVLPQIRTVGLEIVRTRTH